MREPVTCSKFRRDYKRMKRRHKNMTRLRQCIDALCAGASLPAKMRPHKLTGEYLGYWECHIENDWLLIYEVTDTAVLLIRTGTHADLFE